MQWNMEETGVQPKCNRRATGQILNDFKLSQINSRKARDPLLHKGLEHFKIKKEQVGKPAFFLWVTGLEPAASTTPTDIRGVNRVICSILPLRLHNYHGVVYGYLCIRTVIFASFSS